MKKLLIVCTILFATISCFAASPYYKKRGAKITVHNNSNIAFKLSCENYPHYETAYIPPDYSTTIPRIPEDYIDLNPQTIFTKKKEDGSPLYELQTASVPVSLVPSDQDLISSNSFACTFTSYFQNYFRGADQMVSEATSIVLKSFMDCNNTCPLLPIVKVSSVTAYDKEKGELFIIITIDSVAHKSK